MKKLSAEAFAIVYEHSQQFIGLLSPEGVLLSANQTALDFVNCQLEDVVGLYFWETPWWTHDASLQEKLRLLILEIPFTQQVQVLSVTHSDADGRVQVFDFSISPIFSEAGELIYLIPEGRNMTSFYEVKREKDEAIQRYADLFENSTDSFLILENNQFIDCNKAALDTLGYSSAQDLLCVHPSEISPTYQPDGRHSLEKSEAMIRLALEKGSHRFEWVHLRRNGTTVDVEIVLTPIRSGEKTLLYVTWRDIGERLKAEREVKRLNLELENLVGLRTAELEQTLISLKQTQTELLENQKQAALSHLVVGISHEVNTPLGNALTAASYLNDIVLKRLNTLAYKEENSSAFEEDLGNIQESTDCICRNLKHAADLIDSFKATAIMTPEDRLVLVDIRELIEHALRPFKGSFKEKQIELEVRLQAPYMVRTHPVTLQSILSQLLSNVLTHAFEDRQAGWMVIGFETLGNAHYLSVSDDGRGLDADSVLHIFEPFFTTKRSAINSGLGLNVVYNQVQQILHGKITVESLQEAGARFVVEFPKQ